MDADSSYGGSDTAQDSHSAHENSSNFEAHGNQPDVTTMAVHSMPTAIEESPTNQYYHKNEVTLPIHYDETDFKSTAKPKEPHYMSTVNLNIKQSLENHSNLEEMSKNYKSTSYLNGDESPESVKKDIGIENPGFDEDEHFGNVKSTFDHSKPYNGEMARGLAAANKHEEPTTEAVNLELINLKPVGKDVAGPYENGLNGVSGIPTKKDDDAEMGNPYDEYFVPVNEHRKYMSNTRKGRNSVTFAETIAAGEEVDLAHEEDPVEYPRWMNQPPRGEKLYVTMDKRNKKSRNKCLCWTVCLCIVAAALIIGILAAVGVIGNQGPMTPKEITARHFDGNEAQVKGASVFASPDQKPIDNPPSSPGPPLSTVSSLLPTTDTSMIQVPRALESEIVIDNMEFTDELANKNSSQYQALAASLEEALKKTLFASDMLKYGSADIEVKIMDLLPGSVVAKYRIAWRFKEGIHNAKDPMTADLLQRKIDNVLQRNQGLIGTYHLANRPINARKIIDLCQIQNNGCQHLCEFDYNNRLDFVCACPSGTVLAADEKNCQIADEEKPSPEPEPAIYHHQTIFGNEPSAEPEPSSTPSPEPEPSSSTEPFLTPGIGSNQAQNAEPESAAEPTSAPEPEPVSEPNPSAEPKPVSQPQPSSTPEPAFEPKVASKSEPALEPEPTSQPEPISEPEPVSSSEPVSHPEPEPEPEFQPSPESEPTSEQTDRKPALEHTSELSINEQPDDASNENSVHHVPVFVHVEDGTEPVTEPEPQNKGTEIAFEPNATVEPEHTIKHGSEAEPMPEPNDVESRHEDNNGDKYSHLIPVIPIHESTTRQDSELHLVTEVPEDTKEKSSIAHDTEKPISQTELRHIMRGHEILAEDTTNDNFVPDYHTEIEDLTHHDDEYHFVIEDATYLEPSTEKHLEPQTERIVEQNIRTQEMSHVETTMSPAGSTEAAMAINNKSENSIHSPEHFIPAFVAAPEATSIKPEVTTIVEPTTPSLLSDDKLNQVGIVKVVIPEAEVFTTTSPDNASSKTANNQKNEMSTVATTDQMEHQTEVPNEYPQILEFNESAGVDQVKTTTSTTTEKANSSAAIEYSTEVHDQKVFEFNQSSVGDQSHMATTTTTESSNSSSLIEIIQQQSLDLNQSMTSSTTTEQSNSSSSGVNVTGEPQESHNLFAQFHQNAVDDQSISSTTEPLNSSLSIEKATEVNALNQTHQQYQTDQAMIEHNMSPFLPEIENEHEHLLGQHFLLNETEANETRPGNLENDQLNHTNPFDPNPTDTTALGVIPLTNKENEIGEEADDSLAPAVVSDGDINNATLAMGHDNGTTASSILVGSLDVSTENEEDMTLPPEVFNNVHSNSFFEKELRDNKAAIALGPVIATTLPPTSTSPKMTNEAIITTMFDEEMTSTIIPAMNDLEITNHSSTATNISHGVDTQTSTEDLIAMETTTNNMEGKDITTQINDDQEPSTTSPNSDEVATENVRKSTEAGIKISIDNFSETTLKNAEAELETTTAVQDLYKVKEASVADVTTTEKLFVTPKSAPLEPVEAVESDEDLSVAPLESFNSISVEEQSVMDKFRLPAKDSSEKNEIVENSNAYEKIDSKDLFSPRLKTEQEDSVANESISVEPEEFNNTSSSPYEIKPVTEDFSIFSFARCSTGQFQCTNGTAVKDGSYCIPANDRCDSVMDCSDGSDELGCTEEGCPNNFKCASGQCLKRHLVCDGIVNCNDGSDEASCDTWTCNFDEFACKQRKRCLPLSWKCDGRAQCSDGSDEQTCHMTQCQNNSFHCSEQDSCIPESWRCDGKADCANGEDEKLCECNSEQFRCQTGGGCIAKNLRCDGIPQCADRSDEWQCLALGHSGNVDNLLQVQFENNTFSPICLDENDWNSTYSTMACQILGFSEAVQLKTVDKPDSLPFAAFYKLDVKSHAVPLLSLLTRIENDNCSKIASLQCQDFSCGSSNEERVPQARIIGGNKAAATQWPSLTLLYDKRRNIQCTSTLIAPMWAIASYSCVASSDNSIPDSKEWILYAGSTNFFNSADNASTQVGMVKEIIPHPQAKYFHYEFINDVVLVQLSKPFNLGRNVSTVCLPNHDIEPRQLCVLSGWGINKPGDPNKEQYLHYLPVPIIDNSECNSTKHYNGLMNSDKICAGYTDSEKSPCYNDEGAPLMCFSESQNRWELQGVLSHHENCGISKHPAVYSALNLKLRRWITNTIGEALNETT